MALQMNIDLTQFGSLNLTDAFLFIRSIVVTRNRPPPGWTATATIEIYTSKAHKDAGASFVAQRSVSWPVPGTLPTTNLITWVQNSIKQAAGYGSAIDTGD